VSLQSWRARYEIKYVLPAARRSEVIELARPYARPDPHAAPLEDGRSGYEVHTLYLDTPDLRDYAARLERRRVRLRLRVRTYGEYEGGQSVFLEIKRKSGNRVIKHRSLLGTVGEWDSCRDSRPWRTLSGRSGGLQWIAARFCELADNGNRSPVTLVHYEREVLVPCRDDDRGARLTLDSRVAASVARPQGRFLAEPTITVIPSSWIVMELKFNHASPAWMRRIPLALGMHAVPITKFGLSVAKSLRASRPRELAMLTPPSLRGLGTAA
jgi:hypothetical protein